MSTYIEYYEVKVKDGYEYYFMLKDQMCVNRENIDGRSHRIWKMNTRTNKFTEIKNIRKDRPQLSLNEMIIIQLQAKEVEFNDYYLYKQLHKKSV